MDPRQEFVTNLNRRHLLGNSAKGIGLAALASLLGEEASAAEGKSPSHPRIELGEPGLLKEPHHTPKAKRFIYLFMSGGPSQMDTWDHKPKMVDMFDKDFPESVRKGQRLTTMTSGQGRFPIAPSMFKFTQHGRNGTWISELFKNSAKIVDDICLIHSMHTEAINHDPAITYIQTGAQVPGRPSLGAWLAYGLGSGNRDLPSYVVMTPSWTGRKNAQALYTRLWGAGFLPSKHQGVALRTKGDPVLYLNNPPGVEGADRRKMLDALAKLNHEQQAATGDPEIADRIAQYEMAFRMQTSVPELVDLSQETQETLNLYGPEVTTPGTFSHCALLARRMIERNVKCVQLFHRDWDQHGNMAGELTAQCRDVDHGCFGLITDLKRRGLLEDTIVAWGGEFGRTTYCQGALSKTNYGRDHHPRCFTMWLAGAGVKPGFVYGRTDDFSYNIEENPVHIHDLNATLLHLLGVDHKRLTYRFQGRDFRLTDIHGEVVRPVLT